MPQFKVGDRVHTTKLITDDGVIPKGSTGKVTAAAEAISKVRWDDDTLRASYGYGRGKSFGWYVRNDRLEILHDLFNVRRG